MKSLKSAVSAIAASALLLAGCSAGQITQTSDQVAAVDGAGAASDNQEVAVQDVTVVLDDNGQAALKFTAINFLQQLHLPLLRQLCIDVVLDPPITRKHRFKNHYFGPHLELFAWISGCNWQYLEEIRFQFTNTDAWDELDLGEQQEFIAQRIRIGKDISLAGNSANRGSARLPRIILEDIGEHE